MQNDGVMQQAFEEGAFGELRQHDRQRLVRVLLLRRIDVVKQRTHEGAALRLDDLKGCEFVFRERALLFLPGGTQSIGLLPVKRHMHRSHSWGDRAGIGQAAFRCEVHVLHRHDETVVNVFRANGDLCGTLALDMQVVPVDGEEHQHQQGNEDDDDPGSRQEFRGGNHQRHQQRGERA